MNVLCSDPTIYTIDNFLNEEECNHIKMMSLPKLEDSVVSDSNGGVKSKGRTSKTCWLKHESDDVIKQISTRISRQINIPIENAEQFQVVFYGETNEYRQHYDSWEHDNSEKSLRCMKYGGPRIMTALLYLNTVEEGGDTRFTKLNINVNAIKGRLLVFENTYNNVPSNSVRFKHIMSEHAGMPVLKGEKFITNLWFRHYNRSHLYEESHPGCFQQSATPLPVNNTEHSSIQKDIPQISVVPYITERNCHIKIYEMSDLSLIHI